MKIHSNHSVCAPTGKVYINTEPEDEDLYYTSFAALESSVEYIVIS